MCYLTQIFNRDIPMKVSLDQCFSGLISHKSYMGILLKIIFLIRWYLRFRWCKCCGFGQYATKSNSPGLFWVTNVTMSSGLAISLLYYIAHFDESEMQNDNHFCTFCLYLVQVYLAQGSCNPLHPALLVGSVPGQTLWGQRCTSGCCYPPGHGVPLACVGCRYNRSHQKSRLQPPEQVVLLGSCWLWLCRAQALLARQQTPHLGIQTGSVNRETHLDRSYQKQQ